MYSYITGQSSAIQKEDDFGISPGVYLSDILHVIYLYFPCDKSDIKYIICHIEKPSKAVHREEK